ncbi:helicase-like transcription factor [Elysia marginata]|uniref:Helicase-like transcription factor n=1 Tax=Elysia marginata TaxID=1093978 RepID=A0AAV4GPH4_9GAST|nr:helicase-like transcription factor [Elysia marginata]
MRWLPSNSQGPSQSGKQKSRARKKSSASGLRGNIWDTTLTQMSNLCGVLEEPEPVVDLVEDNQETQADPEDEFLGSIRSDIVGVQYYKGVVSNNEMVNLVREPNNKYDKFAVRVDNVTNEQVGHIKREHAKPLSFVVDGNLAKVEGLIPFGANNKFRIPVVISLWGAPDKKAGVVALLKSHNIVVDSNPVKRASSGSAFDLGASSSGLGQANYGHVVSHRTFVSPSEMENAMDQMFEFLDEGDKTTEANPAQAVKTGLYPHQKQALNWMICRENKALLPPFWETQGNMYINTLTICHTQIRPASVCGGILADDMGLGKTLQVIALILTNFVDGKPLAWPVQGTMRNPMALTGKKTKAHASKVNTGESSVSCQQNISKAASTMPYSSSDSMKLEVLGEKLLEVQAKNTALLSISSHVDGSNTAPKQAFEIKSTSTLGMDCSSFDPVRLKVENEKPTETMMCSPNLLEGQAKNAALLSISADKDKSNITSKQAVEVKNTSKSAILVKDPDYAPEISEKLSVVTPISRSRRERKRPVRYIYSDEEDETEEKTGSKPSKGKKTKKGVDKKSVPLAVSDSNKIEDMDENTNQGAVQGKVETSSGMTEVVNTTSCTKIPEDIKENTELLQLPTAEAYLAPPDNQTVTFTAVQVSQNANIPPPSNEECSKSLLTAQSERDSETTKNILVREDMTPIHKNMDKIAQDEQVVEKVVSEFVKVEESIAPPKGSEVVIVEETIAPPKGSEVVIVEESMAPLQTLDKPEVIVIEDSEDLKKSVAVKAFKAEDKFFGAAASPAASIVPGSSFLQKITASSEKKLPKDNSTPQEPLFVFDSDDDDLPDIPPSAPVTKAVSNFVKLDSDYDASTGRAKTAGPRGTLIICPLSVISNWVGQFEEHVDQHVHISLYVYYGGSRKKDVQLLKQQDVVITTYSTLASDFKSVKQSPLHKVEWLRVVLDEGHIIRNPASQQAKAVNQLQAKRKWVITGTPIQNSMKDLWSLINFLGVKPFTERTWWNRTIARPLAQRESKAIQRVSHLMRNLALRRTKTQQLNGRPLIVLPDRHVYLEKISFGEEERAVYEAMQANGKVIIGRYFRQGTLLHHYGEVLAILTRLRQLCCHPLLVASAVRKVLESNPGAAITEAAEAQAAAVAPGVGPGPAAPEPALTKEERQRLIKQLLYVLDSGSDQECAICLDSVKRGVITACAHVYCRPCIEAVIENEQPNPKCPLCRGELKKDQLIEAPEESKKQKEGEKDDSQSTAEQEAKTALPTPEAWQSSAKIDALMKGLTQLREQDPTIKSIVVSQFTSLLDLIEIPLGLQGFHFARLDGSMTAAERIQAVEEFSSDKLGAPTVFLLSLKAGGVGINLTAASRVFLMDPAWNPASEEQCFDRCHRLGQTKEVVITRFVIDDTVEDRMLELQEKKRQLMKGAFGRTQSREERRTNLVNMIRNLIRI